MRPTLDDAAWSSRWRTRSTLEKSILCLGLLLVAATTTSLVVAGLVGVVDHRGRRAGGEQHGEHGCC